MAYVLVPGLLFDAGLRRVQVATRDRPDEKGSYEEGHQSESR